MTVDGVSRRLAEFVAESHAENTSPALCHEAKRSLLNYFACALGGCRDDAMERMIGVVTPFAGPPRAGIIGRREKTDALTAAFLNGISANVFDFDDTHPGTVIHPSAPVAPALFALAETRQISGATLLHAFSLGLEAECRIGNAVSPWHYAKGWHITATCGVFGAAVAVGKCLGLDSEKMRWALGNAAAQSCGLVETLGTMAKSFGVGNAPRNGMLAALAAEAGFSGPEKPLEGIRGFATVMGAEPDLGKITDGLGISWEALRNTYKPYPCGIVLHAVIDACLSLRHHPGFDIGAVRDITVRGHPLLAQRADRPAVTTGREAQVSAQHSVAISLLTGAAGLAQFNDAAVADPAVRDLRRKIRMVDDPTMSVEAAEVAITLADGQTIARRVEQARGGENTPLSDGDLEAKLRDLVTYGGSGCDPDSLIDAIWSLDKNENAGSIMKLV